MRAFVPISDEGAAVTHTLGMPAAAFGLVAFGALIALPAAFGLVAFGALIALLLVTWAFRSVGSRH